MTTGFIYVLGNKELPNDAKVGLTKRDAETRITDSMSPHIYPYKQINVAEDDLADYEKLIHREIEARGFHRIKHFSGRNSEWFKCSPEQAYAIAREIIQPVKAPQQTESQYIPSTPQPKRTMYDDIDDDDILYLRKRARIKRDIINSHSRTIMHFTRWLIALTKVVFVSSIPFLLLSFFVFHPVIPVIYYGIVLGIFLYSEHPSTCLFEKKIDHRAVNHALINWEYKHNPNPS